MEKKAREPSLWHPLNSTEPVNKNVVEVLTNNMLGEILKLIDCFK
jgi:hypothetical protein